MSDIVQSMISVEWHDARFFSGTYTKDACEQHKMCLFNSMGYLIAKDNITTIIAAERNDEGEYRDITLIPTGSIVSIKELIVGAVV
jgi:hypothetical protein